MTARADGSRGALAAGERVLLVDAKSRRYLLTLKTGAQFHTHAGIVDHDSIIGGPEGVSVTGSTGRLFLVVRPTLTDVVLKMPRGAQVIYPKDLGAILLGADIGPAMRVLEAGVGSGALSMALLRAGADVVGYELRPDFAAGARRNVAAWSGTEVPYRVEERDVYAGIDETALDRVVLDLPEPWRVLPHAEKALRPGGILLAYLPTINQVAALRGALARSAFGLAETSEILRRTWHVEERSVRPDHRMVGHTGFLTTARLLVPPADGPVVATPEVGADDDAGRGHGGADDDAGSSDAGADDDARW
ncbi:MAG: tRNA (adenine-N1)-methyltransferase [Acidimicrobiales bacterium]